MGNTMAVWAKSRRCSKIMKIDGTTFKLRQPATAADALADHPNHVLMESEDVKRLGIKANTLHPDYPLQPKKLYFLVQLPKFVQPPCPSSARRVRSGINMTAKDRLESLMLARRAQSDITFLRSTTATVEDDGEGEGTRVKMRLRKSKVARLVKESGGDASVAAANIIMELSVSRQKTVINGDDGFNGEEKTPEKREKRMRFAPIDTTEIIK